MFRNRFWGGLFAVLLLVLLVSLIAFAGYQFGVAQGGGIPAGDLAGPRGPMMPHGGFFFFPFFFGFGLLRFFFFLFLFFLLFRLVFRPWGWGHRGHWKDHPDGPWGDRMREMHDRWHGTAPPADQPGDGQ